VVVVVVVVVVVMVIVVVKMVVVMVVMIVVEMVVVVVVMIVAVVVMVVAVVGVVVIVIRVVIVVGVVAVKDGLLQPEHRESSRMLRLWWGGIGKSRSIFALLPPQYNTIITPLSLGCSRLRGRTKSFNHQGTSEPAATTSGSIADI
jgi:hypothetical protein